jgi:hypothetical protein
MNFIAPHSFGNQYYIAIDKGISTEAELVCIFIVEFFLREIRECPQIVGLLVNLIDKDEMLLHLLRGRRRFIIFVTRCQLYEADQHSVKGYAIENCFVHFFYIC